MSTITRTLKKTIKLVHWSKLKFSTSSFRFLESNALKNNQNLLTSKEFTRDEELLIVETINKCSETDFKKYEIKKSELKKLLAYKENNGKFESFTDILVAQDVPSLIKLCRSILVGGKTNVKKTKSTGSVKNVTVPAVDKATREKIKFILGIQIWSDTISWALLQENNLTCWEQRTFENPSKSSLVPLINLISNITDEIPYADAYVMEADPYTSLNKLKHAAFLFYVQRQQVIATIISILGMRRRLSEQFSDNNSTDQKLHNFFMMASRTSAKRFNLTVANEIMPAESIVKDILEENLHNVIPDFPVIKVDADVSFNYKSSSSLDRDQLHSALLTALAFADTIYRDDLKSKEKEK